MIVVMITTKLGLLLFVSMRSLASLKPVYIGGFFDDKWNLGVEIIAAAEIAVEAVNNSTELLPGYEIRMIWNSTRNRPEEAARVFYDHVYTGPTKIMLIGPIISGDCSMIANAAEPWKLFQFSFFARDTSLRNHSYFFRTLCDNNALNKPRLFLLERFNWTQVGIIYEDLLENTFSGLMEEMHHLLEIAKINVLKTVVFSTRRQPSFYVDELQKSEARIILAAISPTAAVPIFCEAYKRKMYGANYVWIMDGWSLKTEWWKDKTILPNCPEDELLEALDGYFYTWYDVNQNSIQGETPIDGWSMDRYLDAYLIKTKDHLHLLFKENYGALAFDAILAMAYTLNDSMAKTQMGLENYTYRSDLWTDTFTQIIFNLNFPGITGQVGFNKNGDRKGIVQIMQSLKKGKDIKEIATYDPETEVIIFEDKNKIIWKYNRIPRDATLQLTDIVYISSWAYLLIFIPASMGIVFSVLLIMQNIKYREHRLVKLSSPNLNNLIGLGCIFAYIYVILNAVDMKWVTDESFVYLCYVRIWVITLAFSLAFGALFAKTWRIYTIMNNKDMKKKSVKDIHLMFLVVALLLIDAIYLVLWALIDPFEKSNISVYTRYNEDLDISTEYFYAKCACGSSGSLTGGLFVYKGIVLIFGVFMAWGTRKVKIPGLNDSKFIAISIYNVVILCAIDLPISYMINDEMFESAYVISSLVIIFTTSAIAGLVFIPKLMEVRINPEGNIRVTTLNQPTATTTISNSNEAEFIKKLKEKDEIIQQLEAELEKYSGCICIKANSKY